MNLLKNIFYIMMFTVIIAACSDYDDFSTSPLHRLTFSCDTISFDTLFTTIASPSNGAMVYNRNKKDLRIASVELMSDGESGFRVLVDGQYGGYMRDLEIRSKDSLYLFCEITPPANGEPQPQQVIDTLRFTLESGVQQDIILAACGRDVDFLRATTVQSDSTITPGHYVVYDSLVVAPGATLNIEAGTTLYFHDKVPFVVRGRLLAAGTKDEPVIFRGDRTDRMFSYLPYDRVPGQWEGITLAPTSNGNVFEHCDIHSANHGIKMQAGDTTVQRLTMNASRLENFYGHAMELVAAHATVTNSLIANAGGNCVKVVGGKVDFNHCTIANFFVYKVRDVALALHNSYGTTPAPLYGASFSNCIITGSKSDELMGYLSNLGDTVPNCRNYRFDNSLVNTVIGDDENFVNVKVDDSAEKPFAADHFVKIDHGVFLYDFRLTAESSARSLAAEPCDETLRFDKNGVERTDGSADAGCYQFVEPEIK